MMSQEFRGQLPYDTNTAPTTTPRSDVGRNVDEELSQPLLYFRSFTKILSRLCRASGTREAVVSTGRKKI
jgi:hypothetical protein